LARAVVEAKLKVAAVELVLRRVAPRRQNGIAAVIGKFKADDLSRVVSAVVPTGTIVGFGRTGADLGVVSELARC
jgi:hypothetical protein